MHAETVAIDKLLLRLPGVEADDARQLAACIAEYLARHMQPGTRKHLDQLDIRLCQTRHTSLRDLAEHIGKSILKQMD